MMLVNSSYLGNKQVTSVRAELLLSPAREETGNQGHVSAVLASSGTPCCSLLSLAAEIQPLFPEPLLSEVI